MTRIGFADHLFLRMHHGIGFPVYNQFLWWFDESIQREDLENLRDNLSDGLLARRVDASAVPTARERWVNSAVSHPLDFHEHSIDPSKVRDWADGRLDSDIDPETGLGWRLAAAPLADGGTVLSLTASHMVADGGALVSAFRSANSGTDQRRLDPTAHGLAAIGSDVKDAAGQLLSAAGWLLNTAVSALPVPARSAPASGAPRVRPNRSDVTTGPAVGSEWTSPHLVAELDAPTWRSAAEKWGGTSNSLFIAVLTAASGAAGRASIGDTVQWSLPVSDRTDTDTRSNATKIVKIDVPVTEATALDLSPVRAICKSAFGAFAAKQAAGHAPVGISQALVQMLPDAVVARIPQPRDGAEGLASNLGVLPDDFTTVAGVRARAVSGRATFVGADAEFARSLDGGLTAWVCETDTSVTVTVHAMDPDRFPDDRALRDHMSTALERWDLSARFW
ncbi:hypothetical protein CH275_16310 [Rhodococcus sp. 06-235-1A]|uniref:hypothetical protein n=1 Tax=Rhodococcus sp. 06-235-1A TaxID=2022508 RepID=UPI000B9BF365|nr:hypothetical protein [Rhodococcus sp. 06-235-1A]OZD03763.1 hypothetical protein CH275_16310 [Rhodococcus sp. 06-235-1A]